MLCYTFFSNIKGDFVVEAKVNNEKEQKRLRKKVRVLNDLFEGSALFGGLLGGFAAIALLMGGAAEITANLTMNEKAQAIYETAEYQAVANEGLSQLDKKLASGEINQEQYAEGVDALYSIPEVIRFAENANDKELNSFIEGYNESKELSTGVFQRGLPVLGTMSALSLAGAAVVGKSAKKARKEYEEAGGTYDVTKSFDK